MSAICAGVFSGLRYAIIYLAPHLQAGADFYHVSARVKTAPFYRKDYFCDRPCNRCDRRFDLEILTVLFTV